VPYLDTSILGAYYCDEPLSESVSNEIRRADGLAISPLVEIELHSMLALKVRTRELSRSAAQRALAQIRLHVAGGYFEILEISAAEYELARNWLGGFNTSLRTLDTLHLACAFSHQQSLWTADRRLAAAADSLGVPYRQFRSL